LTINKDLTAVVKIGILLLESVLLINLHSEAANALRTENNLYIF
jgi:hypothetical protein